MHCFKCFFTMGYYWAMKQNEIMPFAVTWLDLEIIILSKVSQKEKDKYHSSVQSLCHVWLFVTPWTAACQASLSFTNSRSLLKLMSIELVMPSNHLILCCPLLLLPSIFPSIRIFSNESVLCIRTSWYWSFSFSISPSNEYQGWFPLGLTGLISLQPQGFSRVFSSTTIQKFQFFSTQLAFLF